MRLDTRLLLALNRLAPRPHFPDRQTPEAYAQWEYGEAAYQVGLMEEAGVSLADTRILDVGCGLGGKSVYLAEHGARYVLGVDLLEKNVRAARAFAAVRGVGNVDFVVGDAVRLSLRTSSFDLVVTTDTFEHFPHPEAALSEMTRALRPLGRVVAVFGPFGSPLGSHLYDTIFVPWSHVLFSRDSLAEAIREIARKKAALLSPGDRAKAARDAEDRISYFDRELNRMTLRRFRQIVLAEGRLKLIAWEKRTPPKLRPLSRLLDVPGLDELVTGLLVMVAEKVE